MADEEFAAFDGLDDDPADNTDIKPGAFHGDADEGAAGDADMVDASLQQHEQQHYQEQNHEQDLTLDGQDTQLQQHEHDYGEQLHNGHQVNQPDDTGALADTKHQQQDGHDLALHTTESAGLQQLDQQPSADAAPPAAAAAQVHRLSAANSDAAEDNLLSGLADDADDVTDVPKPSAGAAAGSTGSGTPTAQAAAAAAAGAAAAAAVLPEGVKLGNSKFEQDLAAALAAGRPLNARQRRTLARAVNRAQGGDGSSMAARPGSVDANGSAEGDEQQQQQKPPPSPKVNSTVLYISNLHWWTTDAAVEGAAAAFGPLVSCRFLEERASGRSRGVAVVEFADPEAAKRCKAELHGKQLDGRDVVVAWVAPGNFGMFAKQLGGGMMGRGGFNQQQQHFGAAGMGQMGAGPMGQMGQGFAGRGGQGFNAGGFAGRGGRGGNMMMAGGRGGRGRMGFGGGGGGGGGGGMMGPPMGGEGGMGMNPMNAAFAGNMANPMVAQMMMMAQMAQTAMGMGGRGGMGGMGGGFGGMGPGGGMMGGGGGGGFMGGGEDEQDFKRQRR